MSDLVERLLCEWQRSRAEWHGPVMLEAVREYAEWREAQTTDRIEALESENANMLAHLQAAAGWSDEDMHNPIMAIAARNCARSGLATPKDPLAWRRVDFAKCDRVRSSILLSDK